MIDKTLQKNNVKFIVVHCSDTSDHDDAADIHNLHLSFGWDGIGYHKIILRNGVIQNGRPEYWVGAHVYGKNSQSLGICLIGKDNFTKHQFTSLKKLLINWKKIYINAEILGHRDIIKTKKTCPNFDVKYWLKKESII